MVCCVNFTLQISPKISEWYFHSVQTPLIDYLTTCYIRLFWWANRCVIIASIFRSSFAVARIYNWIGLAPALHCADQCVFVCGHMHAQVKDFSTKQFDLWVTESWISQKKIQVVNMFIHFCFYCSQATCHDKMATHPVSIYRPSFSGMGIPMWKIRWSRDRLIFNMVSLLQVRLQLCIETAASRLSLIFLTYPMVLKTLIQLQKAIFAVCSVCHLRCL